MMIERGGGLSTLYHGCSHSDDGIVWLWHFLVNLFIYLYIYICIYMCIYIYVYIYTCIYITHEQTKSISKFMLNK